MEQVEEKDIRILLSQIFKPSKQVEATGLSGGERLFLEDNMSLVHVNTAAG